MRSQVRMLCFFLFFSSVLSAQITHRDLAHDTIIYRSSFLNRTYLLHGKPLTLPVMAFFMRDYPGAYNEIRMAQLSDQLCITGYSLGSLFTIGGLMVSQQNRDLGSDLIQLGLVGIGTGLIFQVISGSFKFQAVRHYNEEINRLHRKGISGFQIQAGGNQATLVIGFN